PYGAVQWNEETQTPQHWIFDAHLLDRGWDEPRCVQVCVTGALKAVQASDEEMARLKREEKLEELQPESGTRPRVHYKNLRRFTHDFIGGTLIATIDGVTDCVSGATVTLEHESNVVAETVTDSFGEFKLDELSPGGAYRVNISAEGFRPQSLSIELEQSIYLGRIELTS
ncbi:MAG: carboxypeptidase regulatory-like domain-containing protein, partial [Hyphomicrobium sp.]